MLSSCSLSSSKVGETELDGIPVEFANTLKLALEEDAEAQQAIGEIFHYGKGTKRDFKKAFYWYKKSAKQGFASSQDLLGLFYAGGVGVKKDCGLSIKWFKYAYFNGQKSSKSNLAWLLATCEQDEHRDGQLALQLARESIAEIGATIHGLDNLAAALAETGDFDKAVILQERLVHALDGKQQPARLLKYKARLMSYRNHKAWRGASYVDQENFTE